jgi:hypothetical protein
LIGLPGLHFHDLRHTGNHFAAGSGARLRDLMTRMILNDSADHRTNVEESTLTWSFVVERVTRIELALSAWEADVLPLNYTRRALVGRSGHGAFATTSYRNL